MASAAIRFLVPPRAGRALALDGAAALDADPRVARYSLAAVAGTDVSAPIDNACYLGHVVATDPDGPHARAHAERAVAGLTLRYADEAVAPAA